MVAWFSWEEAVPARYQDAQLDYLSANVAAAFRELYDARHTEVEPPWALVVGGLPADHAAWALAVHAARRGQRVAVVGPTSLHVWPGLGDPGDRAYEWATQAADADLCIFENLSKPPPNPPTGDPEDDFADDPIDLLLVRRRRHPGLTVITAYPPETQAREWLEAIHPGLIGQVEQYRGLRVIHVPKEPQLPHSSVDTGSVQLTLVIDDPGLMALCRDYWAVHEDDYRYTVTELAKRYGLRVNTVAKTVAEASTARVHERVCPSCGQGETVTSRQALAEVQRLRYAPSECGDCKQLRYELQELNKAERFPVTESSPIEVQQLALADAVTLLALLRSRGGETFARTVPLSDWGDPFGPTTELEAEWVLRLFKLGLLRIHPESSWNAFEWEEEDPARFYPHRVSYYVSGSGDLAERARTVTDELTGAFRDGPWPEPWRTSWKEVWNELAIAECVAYLVFCLREHDLPFTAGKKTIAAMADALETYSIGQVYSFIWRAAKDAAAYMVRQHVAPARAANSAIGNIQRSVDRARAEGWTKEPFGRNWQLPVSAISHVFFTVAMQVPDLMTVRRHDVTMPRIAEPPPKEEEDVPPGAFVGPDGTVYVSPQPQRRVVSISRNDPCPCGSGKKFKRCCGAPGS